MNQTIYNIYITFGTLPALYAQMNIFLDNKDSYIWTRSGGTFISKKDFPNNLKYYKKFDSFSDSAFFKEQYKDIRDKLCEICNKNSDVKFNIFCDDSRIQFVWKVFIETNIKNFVNKFFIISEGNITEYMARQLNEEYFEKKKLQWGNLIKSLNTPTISEEEKNRELSKIDNYAFYLATSSEFEYLIPSLDLLIKNTSLSKFYKKMMLCSINLAEMYNTLDIKTRDNFINNAIFDIKIKDLFKRNGKVLIINGTYNFANEEITTFIYSNLINKVIDDYKKNYAIIYKAHPLFPVEKNLEFMKFLKENEVTVLSEKFPLELALWEYKNIKVGGFCSTIHSLVPKEQVEFFFGDLNGFAKYIFKDNFNKYYNINLSQDMASLSLKYYYNKIDLLKNIDLQLKVLENNISNTSIQINNTKETLRSDMDKLNKTNILFKQNIDNNSKNILILREEMKHLKEEVKYLKKHIKILEIPIYPLIWIKRKYKDLKERKK